jgi:hypothetical protein
MWSAVFDSDKGQYGSVKRPSNVSKVTTPSSLSSSSRVHSMLTLLRSRCLAPRFVGLQSCRHAA